MTVLREALEAEDRAAWKVANELCAALECGTVKLSGVAASYVRTHLAAFRAARDARDAESASSDGGSR